MTLRRTLHSSMRTGFACGGIAHHTWTTRVQGEQCVSVVSLSETGATHTHTHTHTHTSRQRAGHTGSSGIVCGWLLVSLSPSVKRGGHGSCFSLSLLLLCDGAGRPPHASVLGHGGLADAASPLCLAGVAGKVRVTEGGPLLRVREDARVEPVHNVDGNGEACR